MAGLDLTLDEMKELTTLDKPRKVRLDALEELKELSVQMLDELEESERFGVHITSNTCFVLFGLRYFEAVFNALPWFWPQEYRWMEEIPSSSYILGVGRKHGEEVHVSHVFSLTVEDRVNLGGIFSGTGGDYTTQASDVFLKRDKNILSIEHPGKLLNYQVETGREGLLKTKEFIGYKV